MAYLYEDGLTYYDNKIKEYAINAMLPLYVTCTANGSTANPRGTFSHTYKEMYDAYSTGRLVIIKLKGTFDGTGFVGEPLIVNHVSHTSEDLYGVVAVGMYNNRVVQVNTYDYQDGLSTDAYVLFEQYSSNTYKYVQGVLTCSAGNHFNNYSTSDSVKWGVTLNFCVTSLDTENILAYNYIDSGNYWKVFVNTSGQICYSANYNSNSSPASATWTGLTVTANQWYQLDMYGCINGSYTMYASLIDYNSTSVHSYTSKSNVYRQTCKSTTRSLQIGSANVKLRDGIAVYGVAYGSTATQRTLSVDVNNATTGSTLNITSGGYTLTGGTVYGG